MPRLDRTAFKAHTATKADKSDVAVNKNMTWQERLRIANYLNSVTYNYPESDPPKMDKTFFRIKSR